MNPTITKEGLAAKNRIAEFRQQVNFGATPQQARATLGDIKKGYIPSQLPRQATGFTVPMPDTVPAEALNGNVGRTDVRSMRDKLEQNNLATEQFNTDYGNLMGRIQSPTPSGSLFTNPSESINRLLLGRPTDTQNLLSDAYGQQAAATRGFAEDYASTAVDARNKFGIPDLQTNLAETRKKFADRQVKLRETLRDFETNAERRGVAREFVDSEKAKVEADAYQELADLAIIETAQLGNLTEARTEVTNLLADKKTAYEFEYAGIQSEIERLKQQNTQDAEIRANQLTVALAEKKAQDEKQLAFETNKYNALVEAAPFADNVALDAIKNSTNQFELATLAGPYIGLMERRAQEANIAQSWASAANSRLTAEKTQLEIDALKDIETGDSNIAVQALDSFSGSLNENNRQQYTTAVTGAVKRGNIEQTELALKNAAQSAAGSALREDVIKRDQAIGALRNVQKELEAYKNAGGNTNLLTGGYEDLQNKLGKTSDPKLAAIETRINLALNAYTNAVSGASFTPQESERYANLFPKKSNTNVLNTTKINTLVDSFEANNQVFYGNFFGGQTPGQIAEQAVYDELIANATPEQLKELGIR